MSVWALSTLRRIAGDLDSYQDGRHVSEDALDMFTTTLELVYRDLSTAFSSCCCNWLVETKTSSLKLSGAPAVLGAPLPPRAGAPPAV